MGSSQTVSSEASLGRAFLVTSCPFEYQMDILNPFTDYLLVDPSTLTAPSSEITVYSTLTSTTRIVTLTAGRESGLVCEPRRIKESFLRVTKVFPDSPSEKKRIKPNEYIVGIKGAQFESVREFANSLKLLLEKGALEVAIGVCNVNGKTRVIEMQAKLIEEWRAKGKGLLGCELTEGWLHKYRPWEEPKNEEEATVQKIQSEKEQTSKDKNIRNVDSAVPTVPAITTSVPLSPNEEIDEKCSDLLPFMNEFSFRGHLRAGTIEDASAICRCRPPNKQCQYCFKEKGGQYFFYCQRKAKIIAIQNQFLFSE